MSLLFLSIEEIPFSRKFKSLFSKMINKIDSELTNPTSIFKREKKNDKI